MKKVKFVLAAAVMVIALVANFGVSNNAQSYDVQLEGLSKALADGDDPYCPMPCGGGCTYTGSISSTGSYLCPSSAWNFNCCN